MKFYKNVKKLRPKVQNESVLKNKEKNINFPKHPVQKINFEHILNYFYHNKRAYSYQEMRGSYNYHPQ